MFQEPDIKVKSNLVFSNTSTGNLETKNKWKMTKNEINVCQKLRFEIKKISKSCRPMFRYCGNHRYNVFTYPQQKRPKTWPIMWAIVQKFTNNVATLLLSSSVNRPQSNAKISILTANIAVRYSSNQGAPIKVKNKQQMQYMY